MLVRRARKSRDQLVGNHASDKSSSTVLHVWLPHPPVCVSMMYHIPPERQFVCPSQILPPVFLTLVVAEPFARAAVVMSVVGPPLERTAGVLHGDSGGCAC